MPRIDFYLLKENTEPACLMFACRLIEKAYKQRHRIFIHVNNENEAHTLDEMLWTYKDDSFLPHNLCGEGPEPPPPIQIGWQSTPEKQKDILLNLHQEIPSFYQQFSRILELVKNEPENQALARKHYRYYRTEGYTINTHDLKNLIEV